MAATACPETLEAQEENGMRGIEQEKGEGPGYGPHGLPFHFFRNKNNEHNSSSNKLQQQ
jgi:hypothetical protein